MTSVDIKTECWVIDCVIKVFSDTLNKIAIRITWRVSFLKGVLIPQVHWVWNFSVLTLFRWLLFALYEFQEGIAELLYTYLASLIPAWLQRSINRGYYFFSNFRKLLESCPITAVTAQLEPSLTEVNKEYIFRDFCTLSEAYQRVPVWLSSLVPAWLINLL